MLLMKVYSTEEVLVFYCKDYRPWSLRHTAWW
jgi:hypothetical protein